MRQLFVNVPTGDVTPSPGSPSPSSGTLWASGMHPVRARSRGHLRSLTALGGCAGAELALEHQARAVLGELIEAVGAECGYLFLGRSQLRDDESANAPHRSEVLPPSEIAGDDEELVLACLRQPTDWQPREEDYDSKLVHDLWLFGSLGTTEDGSLPVVGVLAAEGQRAGLATPLAGCSGPVGVVYLDRPATEGPFSEREASLLRALAFQVPLVFEIARSLRGRARADEAQRRAERLEGIARVAGGMAHHFNNMLSVVLSASEQILADPESLAAKVDARAIRTAAERARDLTGQLLAFSQGQYLNAEALDLNDLIARLLPSFRSLCGPGVALDTRFDAELCRIKADAVQIEQVLTNLIVNARDAMPSGGTLSIETRTIAVPGSGSSRTPALAPGRYARVVVSDTGRGMDETTRAKAFEPFFTTKPSGSGLGLAMAYGIVTQSGGHIELESQLGSGTTFRLFFPETAQRLSSMPPPLRASQRVPRGTETILVVDDEPLVRESTRRMLRSLGYTIIVATSSEEALCVARERLDEIDLVISDVIMPGMNGLELARELVKLRSTVRVLFVSGYTAGVLSERGVLGEAVDFLQKPASLELLATRVRSILDVPWRAAAAPGEVD